jgi:hypothetical protein
MDVLGLPRHRIRNTLLFWAWVNAGLYGLSAFL